VGNKIGKRKRGEIKMGKPNVRGRVKEKEVRETE
jgi:hypothetical protein